MMHETIDAAGHAPQLDRPEVVAQRALRFLASRSD